MTVRELINALLDCDMDQRAELYLLEHGTDNRGDEITGYVFDIESVEKNSIVFKDWRKDKEESK
jgi:hypothetical protein